MKKENVLAYSENKKHSSFRIELPGLNTPARQFDNDTEKEFYKNEDSGITLFKISGTLSRNKLRKRKENKVF